MGSTVSSVPHMIHFAGDLRRQAKQSAEPEEAAKLQQVAANLETQAFAKAGITSPNIGRLFKAPASRAFIFHA
jgi:hypothetical protein